MQVQTPCPGREQLLAFSRGELEAEGLEAVCAHVSDCTGCEAALAEIEESDDAVVRNLRQFLHREPRIDREECQQLEARAKAISLGHLEAVGATTPGPAVAEAATPPPVHLSMLGKYQLLKELGRGGMGIVFLALHTNLNRKVAVKVIRPEYSHDSQVHARFQREMKAIGELVHPNIVAATDADVANGQHFLVMELIDGIDLESLVRVHGPLPVAEACEIIRQAAVGLQFVHENKRVHRDLKPSNLMLSADGVVKILDLGLARVFSETKVSEELSRSNVVMGTADYMAPEQWADSRTVDIRADIYSLGCTLYKLLAGKVVFSGAEYKQQMMKKLAHAHLPIVPIRSQRIEVPVGLAAVLETMLKKAPDHRFATPREAAEALAPFAGGCDCRTLAAEALKRSDGAGPRGEGVKGATAETVDAERRTPALRSGKKVVEVARQPQGKRWPLAVVGGIVALLLILTAVFAAAFSGGWLGNAGKVEQPVEVEETFQPGILYKRLYKSPTKLFWHDPKFTHVLQHIPERQEVFVNAPYMSLVGCGITDRADYYIQIGIRAGPLSGASGVGLIFGYHDTVIGDKPFAKPGLDESGNPLPNPGAANNGKRFVKYQLLEITPSKGGLRLARSWGTFQKIEGEPLRWAGPGKGIAGSSLNQPVERVENTLKIEARWAPGVGRGLTGIWWNGQALPELIKPEHNAHFTEEDYVGEFGVFNRDSGSTFGNVYFMLYERAPR